MSLKLRLNLIITALLLLIILAGTLLTLKNAQQNARAEIVSTEKLIRHLLDVPLGSRYDLNTLYGRPFHLEQLSHLRHIKIELHDQTGRVIDSNRGQNLPYNETPVWFQKLLNRFSPHWPTTVRLLEQQGQITGRLVIIPDPSYEYAEMWHQTKGTLLLSGAFLVLVNLMVSWAVGQALSPSTRILAALNDLEHGNLSARLPGFHLRELAQIAEKFNLMADTLQQNIVRNRQLSQQLITLQEAERKSLAQDLHDEFGQCLTAIHTDATIILNNAEQKYPELVTSASAISQLSHHLMILVSGLLQRLRPSILDELGLAAAVEDLVGTYRSRHPQIHFDCTMTDIPDHLEETINVAAYRMVQESLTNIVRHAQATQVSVNLQMVNQQSQQGLQITVRDNGRGFANEKTEGFGLIGMRERIAGIGGNITLHTTPGTTILAWIPTGTIT